MYFYKIIQTNQSQFSLIKFLLPVFFLEVNGLLSFNLMNLPDDCFNFELEIVLLMLYVGLIIIG